MQNARSHAFRFITLPDCLLLCICGPSKKMQTSHWQYVHLDSIVGPHASTLLIYGVSISRLIQCKDIWGHRGWREAAVDKDLWLTWVETKVVEAVGFGESHIDGLFIIPPTLAVSPPGPVGAPSLLSQLVHSAQQSANKVESLPISHCAFIALSYLDAQE